MQERCMACEKPISKDRYYCYDCFQALEDKVNNNEV